MLNIRQYGHSPDLNGFSFSLGFETAQISFEHGHEHEHEHEPDTQHGRENVNEYISMSVSSGSATRTMAESDRTVVEMGGIDSVGIGSSGSQSRGGRSQSQSWAEAGPSSPV